MSIEIRIVSETAEDALFQLHELARGTASPVPAYSFVDTGALGAATAATAGPQITASPAPATKRKKQADANAAQSSTPAPGTANPPLAEQQQPETPATTEPVAEKPVTLEEARAVLGPFLKDADKAPKVTAIIGEFSPSSPPRLSTVPAEKLGALVERVQKELS